MIENSNNRAEREKKTYRKKIALIGKNQIIWQQMEMGILCHFGTNTFTGIEWGDGTASPSVFNPTGMDCGQWVKTTNCLKLAIEKAYENPVIKQFAAFLV